MIRLEIFGPNSFWIAINVEKDTRLIKVLDEVCLRKQLGSSDNFDLKNGKKILDLSFTVEMAMLCNAARLELIKSSKPRHDSLVSTVIILSDTNERLGVKSIHFETTLYDLLKMYEEDGKIDLLTHSQNYHPILQYLKKEYIGIYALQNCTLKDLGLFSGGASFIHKFRSVDQITLQNITSIIDKEKKKIENIILKNKEHLEVYNDPFSHKFEQKDSLIDLNEKSMDLDQQLPNIENDLLTEDKSYSSIALAFDHNRLSTNNFETDNDIIENDCDNVQNNSFNDFKIIENDCNNVQNNSFNDFKFPEETKGMNIYDNNLRINSSIDIEPCDRNMFIYRITDESNISHDGFNTNLPDEFFDHTVNDLQVIYRDLKQNLEQLNEESLMTAKLRIAESEKKLSKYNLAVIRVHFPDAYIVQANFKPLENVFQIYKFINGLIEEKHSNFELYTSPPKIILQKSETIFNANLVPLSLLYFSGPRPEDGYYLSMEARRNVCSKEEADIASANCLQTRCPTSCTSVDKEMNMPKSLKISDYKVVPKWFTGSAKKKKVPTATLR